MANNKERIRLLYFHPTAVFGGAERTTATLLEHLDKSIFEVVLITREKAFPPLPVKRVIDIDDLGINDGFRGIRALIKDTKTMIQVVRREKPDIVFGMLHYACILLSFVKLFMGDKVKVIVSPRTPSRDGIQFYFKEDALKRALWHFMVTFFCRHSDYVVVASEGIKEECIAGFKAKRNKIVTVYNSVDAERVKRLSAESGNGERVSGMFVISTAGRLAAEKNMAVLLKAFALLTRDIKATLWIIGGGSEKPYLESLATKLGIAQDVVFRGFQDNPYKFIKTSDVFVHTSLFEGFGNTILEAMACGVPVVATDCPFGPREIITNGENGLLVPVSDEGALMQAIKQVLDDRQLKGRLVRSASEKLSKFSPEKMARAYEEVFLKCMH